MKKFALAILILFLMVNIVSACEFSREEEEFRKQLNVVFLIFFFSSYALIIPIVILYFLQKRVGMWTVITALVSLVLFLPLLFFAAIADMCGYSGFVIATIEFIFMLFLFAFQLTSWITLRRKLKTEFP
jgi:hypothetical protein